MHMIRASIYLVALLCSAYCVTAMELPERSSSGTPKREDSPSLPSVSYADPNRMSGELNYEFSKLEEECTHLENQEIEFQKKIDALKPKINILSGDGSDGDVQSEDRHFDEILKTLPLPTNTSQSSQANLPIISQERDDMLMMMQLIGSTEYWKAYKKEYKKRYIAKLLPDVLANANSLETVIAFLKYADDSDVPDAVKAAEDRFVTLVTDREQCDRHNRDFTRTQHRLATLSPKLQRSIAARLRWRIPAKSLGTLTAKSRAKILFNPDNNTLATAHLEEGIFSFWDPYTKKCLGTFSNPKPLTIALFNPQGTFFAVGSDKDDTIYLVSPLAEKVLRSLKTPDVAYSAAFNHEGSSLAIGSRFETVILLDPYTGKNIATFTPHTESELLEMSKLTNKPTAKRVRALAFNPQDTILAAGSDGLIRLWDTATKKLLRIIEDKIWLSPLKELAFNQEGTKLISNDLTLCFWDPNTGKRLYPKFLPATSVGFDLHSNNIIAFGDRKRLLLYDFKTRKQVHELHGFNHLYQFSFNKSGTILATSDEDGIALWDLTMHEKIPLSAIVAHIVSENLPANTLRIEKLEEAAKVLTDHYKDSHNPHGCAIL